MSTLAATFAREVVAGAAPGRRSTRTPVRAKAPHREAFVAGFGNDRPGALSVEGIITVAHGLGLRVVAAALAGAQDSATVRSVAMRRDSRHCPAGAGFGSELSRVAIVVLACSAKRPSWKS
ncbi:hypothetical protein [Conexibacter sp. S30A1]|uniref:hypothetical protein n=1 Tax=Conexibacter sp. S30A1 TaxID=2937800 RepID=UPI00200BB76F|nr:hypothetical protein [Conexibacter sp. S30A1]